MAYEIVGIYQLVLVVYNAQKDERVVVCWAQENKRVAVYQVQENERVTACWEDEEVVEFWGLRGWLCAGRMRGWLCVGGIGV